MNQSLRSTCYVICLTLVICFLMACTGDVAKENKLLKQQMEDLKQSLSKVRQENTDLRNRISRLEQGVQKKTPRQDSSVKDKSTSATRKVASWKGSGQKTTEPFAITKTPWAVVWSSKPNQYGGILQIYVNTINGELESMVANTMEKTSDISYVYKTGTFYLEINSANTNWAIEVHQAQ